MRRTSGALQATQGRSEVCASDPQVRKRQDPQEGGESAVEAEQIMNVKWT